MGDPIEPAATLAGRLKASEGIPPLYAVTREILTQIFSEWGTPIGLRPPPVPHTP